MTKSAAPRREFPWETRERQRAAALEQACSTCNQQPGQECVNTLTGEPLHKYHPAHNARIPPEEA